MSVRRECCNYCMWLGPVNQDDTMRKHHPAREGTASGERKIQDFTKPHCPGSNKPYARFGCDSEETITVNDQQPTIASAADLPMSAQHPDRYTVLNAGYVFIVRDATTGLDVASKSSRSGAQHTIDCLADGTMVLDSLGKAVAAQKPVIETSSDTSEYGVFEDGECIETGFHGGYGRVAAGAAAKVREDDPANDGLSYEVKVLCPEHEEQAKDTCEECATEGCGAVDADDLDACGHCSDCTG